ncbi:MAG TPA: hypothetical protein VHR42_02775, partial [Clostridia bacterium]|nr:hypothetical protein [Clostridia bacterium]
IHLDLSHLSYHEISRKMAPVLQGKSKRKIISAVTRAAWTVFAVDGLYGLAAKVRCREVEKGAADQIMGRDIS